MKIGDEVFVHGVVDEIRTGTVIIKNKGGYFGTARREIFEPVPMEVDYFSTAGSSDVIASCPVCGFEMEECESTWGKPFCAQCGQKIAWKQEKKG